jgi:hypothetical protein
MSRRRSYPHFDLNFCKIHEHWRKKLADYTAAAKYLDTVNTRLQRWLEGLGPWVDFDFAMKHLQEDLDLCEVESHLNWLASLHRLRLAKEEKKRLSRGECWGEKQQRPVEIKISSDGRHDAVWHEDFRDIYRKAIERERKELRKLREIGVVTTVEEGPRRKEKA